MKEFLTEEYKALTESLHINEETGEKRLTFYTTLVTGVLAGIIALLSNFETIPLYLHDAIAFLVIMTLLSLSMVGWITWLRLKKRNATTDGFKKDLRRIRTIMKLKYADEQYTYLKYYGSFEKIKPGKRSATSLVDVVGIINSFVIGVTIFLFFFFILPFPYDTDIAILASVIVTILMLRYVQEEKESKKQATHAGTVLARKQDNQTQVLLVTSTKTGEWVLPKGHIEANESAEAAAVREAREETGYDCELIAYLDDTAPFITHKKPIVVSYFLAFPLHAEPHPAEDRQKQWVEVGQAISMVRHEEMRKILREVAVVM